MASSSELRKAPLPSNPQDTLSDYSNAPPPAYSAQPQPSASSSSSSPLVLHIYTDGGFLSKRRLQICLPDKKTCVYTAMFHQFSNPDVELHRGDENGPIIGTATFHSFSSDIDITVNSSPGKGMQPLNTKIERDGLFTSKRSMNLFGKTLQFKSTSEGASFLTHNTKLVDEATGQVWALFDRSAGMSKWGKLEFRLEGLGQEQVDGIVIAFLGLLEKLRRAKNSAAAGGGGGGA
jgi:hypothetical protein